MVFRVDGLKSSRGFIQGCPLLTILFVLCVELLAHLIRTNKDKHGLDFDDTEINASLFADDATCTLKDVTSAVRLFELCEQYSKYSGLCLNVSKSLLVYLGLEVKPNISKYEVQIENDFFNILGIFLGQDRTKCNKRNFNHKIQKIKQKLNMWSQRGLSLTGKVLISRSMGISNLIYSLSCVISSKGDLNKAQQIVNDYMSPPAGDIYSSWLRVCPSVRPSVRP